MRRAFLLALLGGFWCAAAEPFFFVQLSDTQFGMYTKDRDFAQETANFEFAVASINRWKPAFVVITGDLVNKTGDPAQIAEYLRIAKKIDASIRVYHLAGNHDVGNEPTPETLALYRKHFGRDYLSFRRGDMAGVVLNSSLIQHPEKALEEFQAQERWLRAELVRLRNAGARELIVFQHIPFFVQAPGEPDQYFNIPLARREAYLDLLREFGVRRVFAGHTHKNLGGRAGALEMVASGPIGMPLDGTQSGLRVVVVKDSGVVHRFYQLGELPNTIDPTSSRPLR